MIPDAPMWSPKRLWFACMQWLFWKQNGVSIPLPQLLRYHRRPWASHRDGVY